MMAFLRYIQSNLSANIHSGAEVVNYPWDWKEERHPDDAWFQLISQEYVDEVHSIDPEYMRMFGTGITNGFDWYDVHGSRQDYVTHYLGGREVTLELSYEFFLDSDSLDSYWNKNFRSLLYYMTQATYGLRGIVRNAVTGEPIRALVRVENHDDSTSVVYSREEQGDYYRYLKGGSYTVSFSAPGYQTHTATNVEITDFRAKTLDVDLQPNVVGSISASSAPPSYRLFPNPSNGAFSIRGPLATNGTIRLKIYSSSGVIVKTEQVVGMDGLFTSSLEGFQPGLYIIEITHQGTGQNLPVRLPLVLQ
jgi:hypothetical protein